MKGWPSPCGASAVLLVAAAAAGCAGSGPGSLAGQLRHPWVIVVLDGVSAAAWVDDAGAVDRKRYPALAALAGRATRFTAARTVSDEPREALAALLTGRWPRPPSPGPSLCTALRHHPIPGADGCAALVPGAPIAGAAGTASDGDREAPWRASLSGLEALAPGDLVVLHSPLPGAPWEVLADGRRYAAPLHSVPGASDGRWDDLPLLVAQARRRHEQQLRFVDSLLGDLLARLETLGAADSTVLVLTATRGEAFVPGEPIDRLSPHNLEELLRVPLLVRVPGQREGRVVATPLSTVDVLPSVAALVGVDLPWPTDGRAVSETVPSGLLRAMGRHHAPFVPVEVDGRLTLPWLRPAGVSVAAAVGVEASVGDLPELTAQLVGQSVSALPVAPPSPALTWSQPQSTGEATGGLSLAGAGLLAGRLSGAAGRRPLLALAQDGTVAELTEAYGALGGDLCFSFLVDPPPGAAAQIFGLYSVEGSGDRPLLVPIAAASPGRSEGDPCRLAGFVEMTARRGEDVEVRGWLRAASEPLEAVRVEVAEGGRRLFTKQLGELGSAAARRFSLRIPAPLMPHLEAAGVQVAAAATGCRPVALGYLHQAELLGDRLLAIRRSDGRRFVARQGALAGAVERWRATDGGVRITGWAADLEAGSPPERLFVLAGDRVVSAADRLLPRPDVAALLGRPDLARSGFSIALRDPAEATAVVAVRAGWASALPVLGTAGAPAEAWPPSRSPRLEGHGLLAPQRLWLDDVRSVRVRREGSAGHVDRVTRDGDEVALTGWAGDVRSGQPALLVCVLAGRSGLAVVPVEGRRDDVAAATGRPGLLHSGFSLTLAGRPADLELLAVFADGWAAPLEWSDAAR